MGDGRLESTTVNLDEAMGRLYAIQGECDRDDLRHTPITLPRPSMTKADLTQLCLDNAAFAADIQEGLGRIYEHAQAALDDLKAPEPPSPPMPAYVAPVRDGAVYGQTKWLYSSLGVDLFLPRGTPVVAPCDCYVVEVVYGTGLQGGAELILAKGDDAWAWRYRHVYADVVIGQEVEQGQQVGVILDTSLDMLGPIPTVFLNQAAFPDGWQHLDLSVNKGTAMFSPTGGGGGNVSSYNWIQSLGYHGRVLARTPGPPDAGR